MRQHPGLPRILCVTGYYKPAYVYGGPVRSVSDLCESLAQAGADVTVFTTDANGAHQRLDVPTRQPVDVNGVQVSYFPVRWLRKFPLPFYAPDLGRACQRAAGSFDVVYIVGTWTYAMWAGARAALQAHVPYVVSPRGSFMDWAMRYKGVKKRVYLALFEKAFINRAAALHVTGKLEQQQQARWGFKPAVAVIPNGVALAPFAALPKAGNFRRLLGIAADDTLSLFVGRLHREKRISLIVEAFARIAASRAASHLVFVGPDYDGSGRAAQAQARVLGLADRVHFVGLLNSTDLLQAYADADLLVLLSHRENFGMVAAEAMAAGLPVLLSDDVGLAEEVAGAEAGLVVLARLEQVVAGWSRLLADPQLRRALGHNGRRLVQEQFAAPIVAGRMLQLFQDVVGGRFSAPAAPETAG